MQLTGTFLDEISHDIPSQNWGRAEWRRDFAAMSAIGIDTVIMIRCGHRQWTTYPSAVLQQAEGCFTPQTDLVHLFLDLAAEHHMAFYFGTYDSGKYWHGTDHGREIELNLRVVDEAWARYGHCPAFKGWYLSLECSRRIAGLVDLYARLGRHCKAVSGGLPVLLSPWIDGRKAVSAFDAATSRTDEGVSLRQHEKEWDYILGGITGAVDIVAFQDGHVDYAELPDYLSVNRALAQKHGLRCWSNVEAFDRDQPIKFLPIKWEKLLLKLRAAEAAGVEKAITFEFSHFLSPNSMYPSAHGLFKRYREWLGAGA